MELGNARWKRAAEGSLGTGVEHDAKRRGPETAKEQSDGTWKPGDRAAAE